MILWAFGFWGWEWWNSYPKVKLVVLAPENTLSGKIDSILIQAINEYRLPGVTATIVKDGKTIYLNAFGFQNLAEKDSLRITSLIPVASVSKLFTALTVANAAKDLEIKATNFLQDSLLEKFPKLRFDQVLEHQTGLLDKRTLRSILFEEYGNSLQDWGDSYLQNQTFLESQEHPVQYADLNFDLLGYWLENRLETNFHNQANFQIFGPSGMDQSHYPLQDFNDSLPISGYQHTFLWKRLEVTEMRLQTFPSPSSGLLTSTRDMSLALIHLLRDEMGNFQNELAWLEERENSKLLGFQKIRMLESDWIGHFGGQAGYSAFFFYSKNLKTGIFLFFNLKDPADYRLELAKKLLHQVLVVKN